MNIVRVADVHQDGLLIWVDGIVLFVRAGLDGRLLSLLA